MPDFLFLEIRYLQWFCHQVTHYHFPHLQTSLVWDSYPLILLSCFTLKIFFLLFADKDQHTSLQKQTPSSLKYVQLQKFRGIRILRLMHREGRCCTIQDVKKFSFWRWSHYQVVLISQWDISWYYLRKLDKGKDVIYLEKQKARSKNGRNIQKNTRKNKNRSVISTVQLSHGWKPDNIPCICHFKCI